MSRRFLTLPLGPEPVALPMRGPVKLHGSAPFWIGQVLCAAGVPHRLHLTAEDVHVRAHKGHHGALTVAPEQ